MIYVRVVFDQWPSRFTVLISRTLNPSENVRAGVSVEQTLSS